MVYNVLSVFIGLLLTPVMLIWFWKNKPLCLIEWIINFLMVGLFIVYMYFAGLWAYITGYYAKYLVIILFAVISFLTFSKARRLKFLCTTSVATKLSFGCKIFIVFIFLLINMSIIYSFPNKEKDIVNLSFPFKNGIYYIAHGGNNTILNYHNSRDYMKYALDIVKLDKFGFRAKGVFPRELEKYNIFREEVYSPCSGTVIEAVDGMEDYPPGVYMVDKSMARPNYIVIQSGDLKVLMSHFQKDSIKVKPGDTVREGQLIGKVGDSGLSFEPHLHIQVTKDGHGVKFMLNGMHLKRNDKMKID